MSEIKYINGKEYVSKEYLQMLIFNLEDENGNCEASMLRENLEIEE